MRTAALSNEPTLRKLGAHLRWLIEKSGVDAERVIVSIGVTTEIEKSLLISTFLREFEPKSMKRCAGNAEFVEVHGVKLFAVIPKAGDAV